GGPEVRAVGLDGPPVIVVSGGTSSCLTVASAGAPVRPSPRWAVPNTSIVFAAFRDNAIVSANTPAALLCVVNRLPPASTRPSSRDEGSPVPRTRIDGSFVIAASGSSSGEGGARKRRIRPEGPSAT